MPTQSAGNGEPAGIQRGQGDLQALSLAAQPVGRRHPDLVEAGHAVLDAAEPHERVAVFHGDARRVHLHHERADAALVGRSVRVGVRRDECHDHDEFGDHPVGGPQLDAVQQV